VAGTAKYTLPSVLPGTNWDLGLALLASKGDCNAFTSAENARFDGSFTTINPGGFGSNWCGATFIAKLSVDLTATNLKAVFGPSRRVSVLLASLLPRRKVSR
jgi:hypothetical protein